MTRPDNNTFEQRLVEALHQEASLAMTLTDTPRELRRWRDDQRHRRNRARIATIAAAAAAVAALIVGLTLLGGTTTKRNEPAHKPTPLRPHQATIQTVQPLPSSVATAALKGPGTVDAVAFGAVWGTDVSDHTRYLYRMSPDGTRVLSRTDLHRYIGDSVTSFAVGSVLLVPSVNGPHHDGYVVVDRSGRQTGFIPASAAGAGAGDAAGGWVQVDIDRVAQVDGSGQLTGLQVQVPSPSVSAIAVGAGSVWVGTSTGTVYRVDPKTAKITGRYVPPGQPIQIAASDSAVYIATNGYQLLRLDPSSMHVTAVSQNNVAPGAWDEIALSPSGDLWVAPDQRGVAELDPVTLDVIRSVQISQASTTGGNFGLGVLGGRMFIGDGEKHRVVSFPLK